jgi:hypothetical protein
MPDAVHDRLVHDIEAATRARRRGRIDDEWRLLEDAHVLSQPWAVAHVRVHWRMLTLALRTHDRRELTGQMIRLVVAGPGSLSGRYPAGNTGRARVGLTDPMPMPPDLARLLAEDSSGSSGHTDRDGSKRRG